MSPLPTTFALERDDRRSHIDLRHAPLAKKDDSMSPEQFAELKALLADMLAPVKELAERQLEAMKKPIFYLDPVAPPPSPIAAAAPESAVADPTADVERVEPVSIA